MQPQDVNKQAGVLPAQTEMPQHYTYLKEFRVEQCQQFQQHKCNQHKPFTCFHWHFQNQRRRRPIRRRDGTFNYSPDAYCTKYDETSGVCPDGDDCPFLHRVAGDVERRYHLRYYKTAACCHDTDSKGMCTKNGAHCAFAHGRNDLRPPVLDVREMQAEKDYAENGLPPPNILDRERNVMTEDPKWQEAGFVLSNYKTEPCKKPPRLCRQGYACPQYHNNKDKRRSPRKHKYRSTPCPIVKSGDEWGDPTLCDAGDSCQYCHTRTEQQFHPEIYKSTRCHDMQQTGCCPRGPFCAFAHLDHEISLARELQAACESGTSLGELLSTALSTNGGKGPEVGGHFSQGSGGGMQRQTSEQDGLKRSQPVEMNANSSPTSSYLSSSLPNRQPLVGSGMVAKSTVSGVSAQQQEEHVLPPGLGPRSYSIGNRAVPTTSAPLASRKPGIGDSSPLISIPTNFMDTLLPSIPPSKQASDGASDALSGQNRQNGGQLGTSFDAIFQDFTAPVGSYSKAPGSEKEATRRRQLSAKDGAFMIGSLDSTSELGLSYGNLMSRGGGFVGSPFAQAPGSQFFAGDGLSGPLDELHLDDPFFGITGHPLDFDEPPKPGSSSLGGLSFSRSSAPVSIPSSTGGMVSSVRWPSESPTSTSLSTQGMMSIGSAGNSFNLAVGSPSVSLPPGFNRQPMLQQQQMHQIGSGRNRAESGAMADQMMSQSPSFKFGSLPVSIAGTPQSVEQENFRLKEENASYRSKMVSWEETVVQARKAYEAWKGEVEAAKALAQSEKQQKEEAQTRVHLLQKEIEQLMQTHGSQNNNNNNLLNALASVNRLPLQELRVVQAQLVRELEKVTKVIQETEAKMAK